MKYSCILILLLLLTAPIIAQKAKDYRAVASELSNQVIATPINTAPFRLAVVPFNATKFSTENSTQFGDYLTETIIGDLAGHPAKIKIFERTRLDAVLKEQAFILTDLMKPAAALKIGQLVPIDALLSGTYTKLKSYVDVSARLIDVASGEILMSYNGRIKMNKNLAILFQSPAVTIINQSTTTTNPNPVNIVINNNVSTSGAISVKSKEEICKEKTAEFKRRLSDISTQDKIDAIVKDAIKIPFEKDCGSLHYEIMYAFGKYKIEQPAYKQFILQTLDTIANPSGDNRAYEITQYLAVDGSIDANEWKAGLSALKRIGNYYLSTYLSYLISKPKDNDKMESLKRVDEFMSLLSQNKVGLPRPISFEMGFLEMMEGMRYNQTLGEHVYKNYSQQLILDDRTKAAVFHELEYMYLNEDRPANKTEILKWIAEFFNKNEYEKAHEDIYEFAHHFLLTDYEDRNEKIKKEYPESDLKILVQECKSRFAAYATVTPYPSQKEDRINFCVKYNIPLAGVIPTLDETSSILKGNNLEEQLRIMKLLTLMGNKPKAIENDLINLFSKRSLDDRAKLNEIQTIAIEVLGSIKTQNVKAIEYMISVLPHYGNDTEAAKEALIKIGKPAVGSLINRLDKTNDQDGGLQFQLITILGKIGKDAASSETSIKRILKINRNQDVVYAAEAALETIK